MSEPRLDERPDHDFDREAEIESDRADRWHDQEIDRDAEKGTSDWP